MLRLGLVSVRSKAHVAGALGQNRLCHVPFCFGFRQNPTFVPSATLVFLLPLTLPTTTTTTTSVQTSDLCSSNTAAVACARFPRSHLQPGRAMFAVSHSLTFSLLFSLFVGVADGKSKINELQASIFTLDFSFIDSILCPVPLGGTQRHKDSFEYPPQISRYP